MVILLMSGECSQDGHRGKHVIIEEASLFHKSFWQKNKF